MATIGGHESAVMKTDVWLTPPGLLSALGRFDLDPCAPVDRPWDTASHHFTKDDDGLSRDWTGRVWLNPPYSRQVVVWLERLAAHGRGTALVFARTETDWFWRTVWQQASAVLFLRGRIRFHRPDGTQAKANAGAPSVLVAYGAGDADVLRDCGIPGRFVSLMEPEAAVEELMG